VTRDPHFVLGQVVELELPAASMQVSAWTIQAIGSHVWFELHAPVRVTTGDPVRVVGAGNDGAVWCLDTEVVEVRDPGGEQIPLVKVIDNGQWVAVQRREYFRVPATLQVALFLTRSNIPGRACGELVAVTTVDLSGGGVQLETAYTLVIGDAFDLALELPARTIHVSGVVARVVPGRDAMQLVGVELGPMKEHDRAELVRFVHDVERRLRSLRDADDR
jgi:c-di-GMP-binding flagellar brake protein YcgR